MARPWNRQTAAPVAQTTLHEITRRYVATGLALSKAMGLPWTETFVREHRESITTCFIEAGKTGIRLSPDVRLPPLREQLRRHTDTQPSAVAGPEPAAVAGPEPAAVAGPEPAAVAGPEPAAVAGPEPSAVAGAVIQEPPSPAPEPPPLPRAVPAGLPGAGQTITDLKPATLFMLIQKLAARVQSDKTVMPLLASLQHERRLRMEAGAVRQYRPLAVVLA